MQFATYYLCLLCKGPAWTDGSTPELEALQAAHLAHLTRLRESGALISAGPVEENERVRGLSLFYTPDLATARALAEADPAVQAGRFALEFYTWWMPAGSLPTVAQPLPPQDS
jgi:uncharacterized protein YciI